MQKGSSGRCDLAGEALKEVKVLKIQIFDFVIFKSIKLGKLFLKKNEKMVCNLHELQARKKSCRASAFAGNRIFSSTA